MLAFIMAMKTEEDREKAAEIYRLYRGTMLYTAKSILHETHLAEDAVSEAFIKIINNFEKINIIDCDQTRSFIVIIVRSVALDILRRQNRTQTISLEDYRDYGDSKEPVFEDVSAREACSRIADCIARLNKNYSDILYLKIEMGYSYEEIAEILGITQENAKMRLSRARKALKEQLRTEGDHDDRQAAK